ncbi:gephyrin-like molybdotransferase receptor GlpR [Kitasatospora paranensis]|uniref:Gephyrin-like molybdotransferase receptor GlpR n=1 Tax=Kitasatospora paranensis TaxID=258053 RepID=A0ABW2G0J7_9ACTN
MSSSGLIYAVIVGAWAAYLVPMWLRRQDELNESRPTERFSTAIRLLAGRSALERRASRSLADESDGDPTDTDDPTGEEPGAAAADGPAPAAVEAVEAAGAAGTAGTAGSDAERPESAARPAPEHAAAPGEHPADDRPAAERTSGDRPAGDRPVPERRARLLARRRRMVTALFLAFAVGAVVAAVAGFAFIWVPALPAVLLTVYIGHLRRLERQRYEVKIDRVRAAQAADRLRAREQRRSADPVGTRPAGEPVEAPARAVRHDAVHPGDPAARPHLRLAVDPSRHDEPAASPATALAEATDHEEWVDGMRERAGAGPDSWEPVPVPLPTYVTAPVAPRVTRGLDLSGPGVRDSGRPAAERKTPLFDQYAAPEGAAAHDTGFTTRPRAANE